MGALTGEMRMDQPQARKLGKLLRTKRDELGLTTRQVSEAISMSQTTVVRLEQGQYLNPDHDKLRALAEALDLNVADVLTMAGYPIPTELPSVGPYLRTKYRNLPAEAVDEIQQDVADVLRRYGFAPNGGP
jgi:transcriptional regulator with XRE-family HTH domain